MESPNRNRTRNKTSRTHEEMHKNRLEATWHAGQIRRGHTVSHKPPPVMVRTSAAARSTSATRSTSTAYSDSAVRGAKDSVSGKVRTRAKKVRRRFDIALSSTGAEVRLPSLPTIRAGVRLISFVLALVLSILIYHFWNSPIYRPEGAQVSGLKRIKSGDVNAVLNLSGTPIFTLDPAQMESDLMSAFPEFSAVSVSVALPRSVMIEVTERIPVMTWRQGDRTELVDAEGFAFPMRIDATALITPVVEAYGDPPGLIPVNIETPLTDLEKVTDVKQTADELIFGSSASNQDVYARQLLTPDMVSAIRTAASFIPSNAPLIYDSIHGLGWRDERGWQAYLGDVEEVEIKLNVYGALIQELTEAGLQPVLVSVEHVHNPYYRLEP